MEPDPDRDRGTHYADGGVTFGTLCYPDPDRIAAMHKEWEGKDGPAV